MVAPPVLRQAQPASHRRAEADRLLSALAQGHRHLAALGRLEQALALDAITIPYLPPVVGSPADQASLQSAAPLYLASELEATGLVKAAENLAGIYMSGGLATDIGTAGPLLVALWQGRNQRFTAGERRAFFTRLFGTAFTPVLAVEGGRNTQFEPLMIGLTEAMHKLYPFPAFATGSASEAGVRTAAQELAANLAPRSGGMASYAEQEILKAIRDAVAILSFVPLQRAVGSSSLWAAVASVTRSAGEPVTDPSEHLERGQAGMTLLAWLAQVLPWLDGSAGPLLTPQSPVLEAATAWLQMSLSIAERHQQQAS